MGCTCSDPEPPAPVVINAGQSATEQATFNKEAALQQRALNMVDQYGPEGSLTYSPTGVETEGIPGMKATKAFSPVQQSLYDTSTRLAQQYGDIGEAQLGKVEGTLSDPFSLTGLGAAPEVSPEVRERQLNAILERTQPQRTRDRAALETRLGNQGFVVGTEGYNTAVDEMNRRNTDFYLAADVSAGDEMSRMFGLESSERDRAVNEILMQRNQPMAELASFTRGTQPTAPSFVPTPQGQIAPPDYMGAQFGAANMQNMWDQNIWNQGVTSAQANRQGWFDLAGSGAQAAGWAWG